MSKNSAEETITVEGLVTDILPGLEYMVEIDYPVGDKIIKHKVECYVSGKMRTNYIQLSKGDKVRVEISLYDINKGRITYRLTQRRPSQGPPRRAKK